MDIIKTWPSFLNFRTLRKIVDGPEFRYFFLLGRGCPRHVHKHATDSEKNGSLWFTHQGRIRGHFVIEHIVHYEKEGQLPPLKALDGSLSKWQFRPGSWIAMCRPPFVPLRERIFMAGFRGWHYFDLNSYRSTFDAKVRL
jgi:hypothetical protein